MSGSFAPAMSAVISDCGKYRYHLTRRISDVARRIVWILTNPSVADAEKNDPTIRRVIGFSRRLGYGMISVVNMYAFRATLPFDLTRTADPVGPDNDAWIRNAVGGADLVVAAWGAPTFASQRAEELRRLLRDRKVSLWCLGQTAKGHPRHPLYLPKDAPLYRWVA